MEGGRSEGGGGLSGSPGESLSHGRLGGEGGRGEGRGGGGWR